MKSTFFYTIALFLIFTNSNVNAQTKVDPEFTEVEPGVWVFSSFKNESHSSILCVDSTEIYLFDTQLNDDDNKTIINFIKSRFSKKKLAYIFTTSPEIGRFIGVKYYKSLWPNAQFVMPKFGSEWMFSTASNDWEVYKGAANNHLKMNDLIIPDNLITKDTIYNGLNFSFTLKPQFYKNNYSCFSMQINESGTGFGFAHFTNMIQINNATSNSILLTKSVLENLMKNHLTRLIGNEKSIIYTTYDVEKRFRTITKLINTSRIKVNRGLTLTEMQLTTAKYFSQIPFENTPLAVETIYNELKNEQKEKSLENNSKRNKVRKSVDKGDAPQGVEPEQ